MSVEIRLTAVQADSLRKWAISNIETCQQALHEMSDPDETEQQIETLNEVLDQINSQC